MNWKIKLKELENEKNWTDAIALLQSVILKNPNNLDAYLFINYLLMNILVEEEYDSSKFEYYCELIKSYFKLSYENFFDNPEYLFWTGFTATMSEWFFEIEIEKAELMLLQAYRKEPDNILYIMGFLLQNEMTKIEDIYDFDKQFISKYPVLPEFLQNKGALGEYLYSLILSGSKNSH